MILVYQCNGTRIFCLRKGRLTSPQLCCYAHLHTSTTFFTCKPQSSALSHHHSTIPRYQDAQCSTLKQRKPMTSSPLSPIGALHCGEGQCDCPAVKTHHDYVMWHAAALEATSSHPLAMALVAYAAGHRTDGCLTEAALAFDGEHQWPPAACVEVHPGQGLSGRVDGRHVVLGNEALMHAQGMCQTPFPQWLPVRSLLFWCRGEHLTRCACGAEIWPFGPTKQL